MAVRERTEIDERDELVAELLRDYPPIRRLEELMGPEPTLDEAEDVDAFLQARAHWQQPYRLTREKRQVIEPEASPEVPILPLLVVADTDVVSFLFKRDTRAELYRRHLEGRRPVITAQTLAELWH